MKSKITYNLDYREKGQAKSIKLNIEFFSNWCRNEYNKIMLESANVQACANRHSDILTRIAQLQTTREGDWKEEVKDLNKEIEQLTNEVMYANATDLLKQRFELLSEVLRTNGYKKEFLFDYDWWDKNVDPMSIIEFLGLCANKDMSKKKVQ